MASGVFKPGVCFYCAGTGQTSRQIFNVEACRQALLERTAKFFKARAEIESYDERQLARTKAKGGQK